MPSSTFPPPAFPEATRRLFEEILDIVPVNIFVRDADGRFLYANHQTAAFIDRTPQQMLGRTVFELYPPAIAERFHAGDLAALAGEEVLVEDWIVPNSDETPRQYLMRKRAVEIEGRKIVVGASVDISDRLQAVQKLAESEARFRHLIEGSLQGILIIAGRRAHFVNQAFVDIFGFRDAAEVLGFEQLIGVFGDQAEQEILAIWARMTAGEDGVIVHRLPARRRDGSRIWVDVFARSIRWDGRAAMQLTLIDVTQRTLAEEALEASNRALEDARARAEEADRAKSQFLAVMSHELRTPLTGVIGMVDLLRDTALDREQAGYAETLKTSAQSLLTLLNDILDLSKIEAGGLELEEIDFDLVDLLSSVLALYRVRAQAAQTDLDLAIAPDVPRFLRGDPTRLRQILLNLIGNAVKFTPAGRVAVRVALDSPPTEGLCVRFEVTDTGIGISPAQQARLFQPFVQADASTTRKYGGTGLGLAICRRLAEAMGGSIGVTSALGAGSTFTVRVPMQAGAVSSPVAPRLGAEIPACRLLVAEDNEVTRTLLRLMLTRHGHQVLAVENGREAVAAVQNQGPFDLAILDMQMPEMDGYAAALAIRALPGPGGQLPLIALTADVTPECHVNAARVGMARVLPKPIDWPSLLAAMTELLPLDRISETEAPERALPPLDAVTAVRLEATLGLLGVRALWAEAPASLTEALGRLVRAQKAQDWDQWRQTLQALVGLAQTLGAARLQAAVAEALAVPPPELMQGQAPRLIDRVQAAAAAALAAADLPPLALSAEV